MGEERPAGRSDAQLRAVCFAAFELDVRAGELRKHGVKVRLQEQPFQVLLMLLERPGEVVMREEIRKKLWPNDTIVEFAPSINAAIQRLRDALGDSADHPRYVETVARRGYRFIGELTSEEPVPESPQPSVDESVADASDLTGHTLSHYRVYEKLGRGGMGEVYRARDTKLGRDVALKVLPDEFARDPDRMARFEREAQVLASMNHPNIAAIYGLEEANGIRALVMELVEGLTLAERIARGPIPLEDALPIAQQMADGLEAAHAKSIVHRDLKAANVKVTPQGVAKVLDFGLATVMQGVHAMVDNPENSPTRTATVSRAGVILGTAAYMAPEQARGETADKRVDIWAFGVVLFEMVSGKRLFEGETTTEILSSVLTKEPEWEQAPAKVQRLLRRCLEKDPKLRLRDIGELPFWLDERASPTKPPPPRLPWVVAAIASLIAVSVAIAYIRRPAEEPRVVRLSMAPPEKSQFALSHPALSPDGRHLAFVATTDSKDSLWVRELDSLSARQFPGTEGARNPFWSPDSRFIGFFASGKVKKIDVAAGSVQSVCDAPGLEGSWSQRDVILFAEPFTGLRRVPAAGGTPTPITALDTASGEAAHLFPWFLPDGLHYLFLDENKDQEKSAVYVADLDSKTRRRVLAGEVKPAYAPPGYLLFVRNRTLMAEPFDAGQMQTSGDSVPIAEDMDRFLEYPFGLFAVSQNGVLAYLARKDERQLTWFDRSGKAAGTVGAPGHLMAGVVSPGGNMVAAERLDPRTGLYDVWLHDLKRGTDSRLTTSSKNSQNPVWSPDSTRIVYSSDVAGAFDIYQKAINGVSPPELLDNQHPHTKVACDWSHDGRYIIEVVFDPKTRGDIWVLPLFGDRKAFPYLRTEFEESDARLSPNGRWMAYDSDETGRPEIYVQNFPVPSSKWRVSTNGGEVPTWSADGKELFFNGSRPGSPEYRVSQGRTLMAAQVKEGDRFEASVPKPLFDMPQGSSGLFDVSPDGRFIVPVPVQPAAATAPITVVINWAAALKK